MRRSVIAITLLVALAMVLIGGCVSCGTGGGELTAVEIREYEGEDLSSINSFRENSIKGPQDVDIASYRLKITGLVDNPQSY